MDIKEGQVRGSQVVGASVNYSPEFNATEPNLNLLRRLAESGGGKLLDKNVPALNPFSHERRKTYQPRDLWETLIKIAIILFTLDVGVRRVQIDREEWERLKARLLFRRAAAQPGQLDDSLTALLARRDHVRSTKTAAAEPKPELFRPAKPVEPTAPGPAALTEPQQAQPSAAPPSDQTPDEATPASTTSRLLEAKRRAQRRKGGPPDQKP
jgi:hypothetical protein